MNKFLIEIQAKLDELKSKENINEDIVKIQKQIDTLKIQTDIDSKSISDLVKQLEKISNQKINISDISIDKNAVAKAGKEANKEIEKNLNIDDIINKAVKRMTELTGRSSNKIFTNKLEQIRDTLNEDKDIAKLFDTSIEKTFNTSSLSNMVNILRTYKKELLSFDDVSKQFASTITSQFSTVIPESQKIDESIFEICKTFARFKNETQESYQTTGKNFFNWIQENATESEKEIFHVTQGFEKFQAALRGLSFNNSNLFNYSTTLDLDTLNYNSDAIDNLLMKESALVSESNVAEQKLSELRQVLIDAFHINTNPDGSLTVTLDQLQEVVSRCPQAQSYIDEINSSLVQISGNEEKATENSSSFAETVVQNEKKKQQAIQETVKVQEQLKKNGNIIQQTDFATSFDTKGEAEKYFNTLSKTVSVQEKLGENKNLESFIVEAKNAEGVVEKLTYKYNELNEAFEYSGGSINDNGVIRQINTIAAKADSLQTKLDKLKSNYSDTNASRPIKDSNNISALSQQYDKVLQAIENVRNTDNTTFSSMVSNAQNEISVLESMIAQFRNAENVATQMKSVDISSGIAQAQERLGKLKANSSGFEQMTQTIHELDVAIEGVGDKSSLDKFLNSLKVAEAQLGRVKAEAKELSKVNEIQLLSNGGIKNDYSTQIAKLEGNFKSFGFTQDEVSKKMGNIVSIFDTLKGKLNQPFTESNYQEIISLNNSLQRALAESSNEYEKLRVAAKGYISEQQRLSKANVIEAWNIKNKNATQEVLEKNQQYINSLRDLDRQMTQTDFNAITDGFNRAKNSMTAFGKTASYLKTQISQAAASIVSFVSLSRVASSAINALRKMPSTVTDLDTALVDLKKTAKMSAEELEDFYYSANDTAKQMGVTTEEIIKQAAAWSRLGFSTAEAATKMAKLSSQFALISPGLSVDDATSGLVSVMKAYDISVSDVLDGIESKINIIGNNLALSNADIVTMLQDSVSAMAESRNSLEETIALEAAAYEITQNTSVGNGFKTVALRLRGMNEETEELDDSLKNIKGDLYELTGVSIMEDENTYKSTYQILKEISGVWDSLTDKKRSEALELMFGKLRSNIGAAVLKNFSAAEKAMDLMADSAGNADAELSVAMDSIEYKMNRLSETGTSIAQNLFKREDMKSAIDALNSLLGIVDKLTDKIGLFGTVSLGTGLFAGIKNVGMAKLN